MIGTRACGINLGLVWMAQDNRTNSRMWHLVTVDENHRITEVLYSGARTKVAQEAAKMTGRLPVFWYECITQLKHDIIRLTPAQVQKIAHLTYKQMVKLNSSLDGSNSVEHLNWFLSQCS